MRAPTTLTSALLLLLGACAPGNTVIHVPDPTPAPTPAPEAAPEPDLPDPLEITVGRPIRGKVLLQTNRPAYVAIFEIVPDEGVTLVQPMTARNRRLVVSGLSTVPVWWSVERGAGSQGRAGAAEARYIYAVASDEPLRLPDEAFKPGYLRRVLGARGYRAESPYATMRALSRHFVRDVIDEQWAEDAYALTATASSQARIARVYCPDGTMFEVPVELADRALCRDRDRIVQGTVRRGPAVRPDSVLAENGRRVRAHGTSGRRLADRVTEPTVATTGGQGGRDGDKPDDHGEHGNSGNGNNGNGNNGNHGHGNNGNAYGHDKDEKPNKVDKPVKEEKQKDEKPAKETKPRGGLAGRVQDAADDDRGRADEPKEAKPATGARPDSRPRPVRREEPAPRPAPEPKAEEKPGAGKPGSKAEEKQEPKGEQGGGAKEERKGGLKDRVKGDDKPKGKEDDKGESSSNEQRGNSGKPE